MEETADACMQKRGGKSFSGSMMMTMMMPSSKRNRDRDCDIHWLTRWLVGWLADEKAWICCNMEHVERASRKDVGFPFWAPSWALHIPHTNRCINYFFFVFTLFALYVALTHCDHECYRHKNFFSPISFSIVYLFVVVSAISFSVYLSYSHFSNWQSWREK